MVVEGGSLQGLVREADRGVGAQLVTEYPAPAMSPVSLTRDVLSLCLLFFTRLFLFSSMESNAYNRAL